MPHPFLFPSLLVLASALCANAAEIRVSACGGDVATVAEALARAEAVRRTSQGEPIEITLDEGVHYLRGRTLLVAAGLGGTPAQPTRIRARVAGRVVVHAGYPLGRLEWHPMPGMPGMWAARLPQDAPRTFGQLYLDGVRQTLARHPNATDPAAPFMGAVPDVVARRRPLWKAPAFAYWHALAHNRWGSLHYRVATAPGAGGQEGGWQVNREVRPGAGFVEGPVEEIDVPGEWAIRDGFLHYQGGDGLAPPAEGWSVDGADIALAMRGTRENPVGHVQVSGIRFTGTARTFMDTREPLLLGDWCIARKAAVVVEDSVGVRVSDCEFDAMGGNAVLFSRRNVQGVVERCRIRDAGAGGVCFVGDPASVRSPRFRYGEPSDSATLDRTPGPSGDAYPRDCRVSDCYMHDLGRWEKQVAGVHISMAARITVERNTIHRVPRAAINVNDGTWGGHRIVGNDAWDTVRETHDHGTFNSWGRDRFWQLDGTWNEVVGPRLELVRSMARLDAVEPSLLSGNRFDCRHGWGIDLDDGSSNYVIEDNLVTAGGIKLREGFFRTVRNNIVVGDTLHPHVWYRGSGDSVTGNVFGAPGYANIGADLGASGGAIDRNLFAASAAADAARFRQHGGSGLQDLAAARKSGVDKASVPAAPRFVDEARGDFRLRPDSPALALGFKPFAMDFGTRVPGFAREAASARAAYLAGHPIAGMKPPARGTLWGATVSEVDAGLRSAAGLPDEDGLYLLDVPAGSVAAALGLKPQEVLRGIDGRRIQGLQSVRALLDTPGPAAEATLTIQDPRTQRETTRRVRPAQ